MAKSNKYLQDLEDKFTRKHNEIDRLALVIAADDAGVEDVDGLLDRQTCWQMTGCLRNN